MHTKAQIYFINHQNTPILNKYVCVYIFFYNDILSCYTNIKYIIVFIMLSLGTFLLTDNSSLNSISSKSVQVDLSLR